MNIGKQTLVFEMIGTMFKMIDFHQDNFNL
jgi:hypothetical protein